MSNDTFSTAKSALVEQAIERMDNVLDTSALPAREAVAAACRILAAYGHAAGLSGQITARGAESGSYWTQPMNLGFDEITEDGLLLVDENLVVLEGAGMPNPANRFHSWLYRARPDIECIIHSHALHTAALSMIGTPLEIAHMDTCVLYDQVAYLPDWPGIPVGNEEGSMITEALADKRAILLAHHGLLATGATVEEACVLAVMLEHAAHLQMLASSAGAINPIEPSLGREAQRWLFTPKRAQVDFAYLNRRTLRERKTS